MEKELYNSFLRILDGCIKHSNMTGYIPNTLYISNKILFLLQFFLQRSHRQVRILIPFEFMYTVREIKQFLKCFHLSPRCWS